MYKPPRVLIQRGDLTEGFFVLRFWGAYIWRGLYMHGGAYFRNFTVFNQIKFFLKHLSLVLNNNKLILITNTEADANLDLTFLRDVGYIIFIFNKSYKNKYRP